ncbi:MAG TPA: hypothetical protein VLD37_00845 [Candidatus Bilamarchaeum sp.]|nr:hypothetical protein [Candidatus Bilamarchaeum sp.]
MTAVDVMAARRNAIDLARFSAGISATERGHKFSNPELAYSRFSVKARTSLDGLKEKLERAQKILEKAYERSESGEIDVTSLGAEAVSARIVLSLSEVLGALFDKAVASKDIYALRMVAKAAEKLTIDSDELLKESVYPRDPAVKKNVIAQNIALARATYDVVVGTLDNTHREHGIEVPAFPAAA